MKTILLIEDDDSFRITVAQALQSRGYRISEARSGAEALALLDRSGAPDGILLDMRLGSRHGMDLIALLRSRCPEARLVVLTGYGSIPESMKSLRLGADDYLLKPAGIPSLLAALHGRENREIPATADPPPSLARVEWEHIQRILHDCDGNISRAAKRLGIDRRTLQRKLAKQPPDA